ncbi:hypothetical protein ANO14919_079090 [Xylariales sp. No.14919]|nr:hypothetical protein ANO14919_079090 [Xylariales sp. No.14919]
MAEILRSELQTPSSFSSVGITDVKDLSSYNWVNAPSPTIVVPGSPPFWAPPRGPLRVNKDSGSVYVDQNAARHPESPLEPLFLALFTTLPFYDIRGTDVVTDRNNILKLLFFIEPDAPGVRLEPFTFNVEINKSTALFLRVEESNEETIGPGEFRGFGHQFQAACTRSHIPESTGHYRIISCRFGEMNFIIRHDCGAYTGNGVESYTSGDGASALESLSLNSNAGLPHTGLTGSRLTIQRGGKDVPLDRTLLIKTRVSNKPLDIQEFAARLWISQTPKLIRAYHKHGTFTVPEVEDVSGKVESWEMQNRAKLSALSTLLHKILAIAKRCGDRVVVRYIPSSDKLIVSRFEGKRMLPEYLYSKWDTEPILSNPSQATSVTTKESRPDQLKSKMSVQVGTAMYDVDLKVMPYFKSYEKPQQPSDKDSSPLKHDSIPLFDEVFRGLSKGPRELFRLVPNRLSEHRVLCNTLKLLGVDILEGRTLRHIMDDFRSGKDDWDPDGWGKVGGLKSVARDSAFRLLYMFLSNSVSSELRDKNMAYNAALFVISHRGIFRYRARSMVLAAFTDRFGVSEKQRKNLDKWPLKESSFEGSEESATSVSEDTGPEDYFNYYDSDDSF